LSRAISPSSPAAREAPRDESFGAFCRFGGADFGRCALTTLALTLERRFMAPPVGLGD
jgi:hypothetical protein